MEFGVVIGYAVVALFVAFVGYRVYKAKSKVSPPSDGVPGGGGGGRPDDPPRHRR